MLLTWVEGNPGYPPAGCEANPSRAVTLVAPGSVHAVVPLLQPQRGEPGVTAGSACTQRVGEFLAGLDVPWWVRCQSGGPSLMRTKLMVGLFGSP